MKQSTIREPVPLHICSHQSPRPDIKYGICHPNSTTTKCKNSRTEEGQSSCMAGPKEAIQGSGWPWERKGKASRMPELLCRNWSLMYILALVSVFPLLYGSLQLS